MHDSDATDLFAPSPEEESILDAFEEAHEDGACPELSDFLRVEEAKKPRLMLGLVAAALEIRIRRGDPTDLQDFVERYPERPFSDDELLYLLKIEIRAFTQRALKRRGPMPRLEEYRDRYPQFAGSLPGLFHQAGNWFGAVGGFEVSEEIGKGGMGVVFRARDLALHREVAVKILQDRFAPDSGTARRFVEEAQITSQLQHPGIPAVYQMGELLDGRPYLAMKLIKGKTLEELIQSDTRVDTLAVFESICQTVGYAHAHQVIHRDLKPQNVMAGAFGEVQVMDWGLAKVLNRGDPAAATHASEDTSAPTAIRSLRDTDEDYTQAGSVMGTPAFMAPEQAIGAVDEIDRRTDVFGLGAILCAMLTGKPPYLGLDAETVRKMAARCQLEGAFARLDGSGAEPELVTLCKQCLSAERSARPADGEAVATHVAQIRTSAEERARQAEMDLARTEIEALEDRRRSELGAREQRKRRRLAYFAGSALLLTMLIGTVVALAYAGQARKSASDAQEFARKAEANEKLATIVDPENWTAG